MGMESDLNAGEEIPWFWDWNQAIGGGIPDRVVDNRVLIGFAAEKKAVARGNQFIEMGVKNIERGREEVNRDAIFADGGALKEEAMVQRRGNGGMKKERYGGNMGLPELRDTVCFSERS